MTSESGSVCTRLLSYFLGPLAERWISREPYDARTWYRRPKDTIVIDTDRSYESVRAFSRDVRHVDLAL